MKNPKLKLLFFIVLFLCGIVLLSFLRQKLLEKEEQNDGVYAPMVDETDNGLLAFREKYPAREVIMACAEDINGDDIADTVVISRLEDDISTIVFFSQRSGVYGETPAIPAPRENQRIRFFNMDKDGVMETLITGEKNGQVGYAIYRLVDGQMLNLFGEGMEDCC